jgi:molybdopterin converting factor small subunit
MVVTVRTVGLLKSLFGRGELQLTLAVGATVDEALAALAAAFGERVALHLAEAPPLSSHPPLRVMVNGRDIAVLGGRQAVLQDGDDVLVLTPIAGG